MSREWSRVVVIGGALAVTLATALVTSTSPRAAGERDPQAPIDGPTRVTHDPFDPSDPSSCATCHEATSDGTRGGVSDTSSALCLTCHDDPARAAGEGAHVHNAASGRCVDCHNAHNATESSLLLAPPAELCVRCHSDVQRAMKSAVPHGALAGAASCTTCHAAHASREPRLLRQDTRALCTTCHASDALVDHRGKTLVDVGARTRAAHVHAPIETEGCTACHAPHGGDRFRMLKENFPSSFYAPYTRESYALCFQCHEESLVEARVTTTATEFRDGDQNLHAVHVDAGERGRTCRACHDVHGATEPHLLQESVPFGSHGWRLPLNWRESEHGGSCAKTCHMVKSYDRTRPTSTNPPPIGALR